MAPLKVHFWYSTEVDGQTVMALHITKIPHGVVNESQHEEIVIGATTAQLTETPHALGLVFNDGDNGFVLLSGVLSREESITITESMLNPK